MFVEALREGGCEKSHGQGNGRFYVKNASIEKPCEGMENLVNL